MDIEKLLQLIQQIAAIIQALRDMGLKLNGEVNAPEVIALFKK